jgi:hypothetical protein
MLNTLRIGTYVSKTSTAIITITKIHEQSKNCRYYIKDPDEPVDKTTRLICISVMLNHLNKNNYKLKIKKCLTE